MGGKVVNEAKIQGQKKSGYKSESERYTLALNMMDIFALWSSSFWYCFGGPKDAWSLFPS